MVLAVKVNNQIIKLANKFIQDLACDSEKKTKFLTLIEKIDSSDFLTSEKERLVANTLYELLQSEPDLPKEVIFDLIAKIDQLKKQDAPMHDPKKTPSKGILFKRGSLKQDRSHRDKHVHFAKKTSEVKFLIKKAPTTITSQHKAEEKKEYKEKRQKGELKLYGLLPPRSAKKSEYTGEWLNQKELDIVKKYFKKVFANKINIISRNQNGTYHVSIYKQDNLIERDFDSQQLREIIAGIIFEKELNYILNVKVKFKHMGSKYYAKLFLTSNDEEYTSLLFALNSLGIVSEIDDEHTIDFDCTHLKEAMDKEPQFWEKLTAAYSTKQEKQRDVWFKLPAI